MLAMLGLQLIYAINWVIGDTQICVYELDRRWLQGHSLLHVLKQAIERIGDGLLSIGPQSAHFI